jgi:hypothetical protein
MNPLIKAFGLSLLNVIAFLFLRLDDVYASLFPGKELKTLDVSGGHFILFWSIGMFMIVLTAIIAGKLSVPKSLSFRKVFSGKR